MNVTEEDEAGPGVAVSGASAARAGLVLFLGQGASRLIGGAGTLVVITYLEPSDLGAVAAAMLIMSAVEAALNLGLGPAVQALGPSDARDRTALTLAVVASVMIGIVTFAIAPFMMGFLGQPSAADVLRALAPVLVLNHWASVRKAIVEREFTFGTVAVITTTAAVAGVGAGVLAAARGAGLWALVIQAVTSSLISAVGLGLVRQGVRRLGWDRQGARDLWRFSRRLLRNSLYVFAYNNVDDAVISRLGGATPLGLYSFAYRVANLPTELFTHTSQRLMLPLLSTLRRRQEPLAPYYLGQLRVLSVVVGLFMFGLLLHGEAVVETVYGRTWTGAMPTLRILACYGLFRSIGATTGAVFLSAGRPELVASIAKWQTLGMVAAIVPAFQFADIAGAAIAVTAPLVAAATIAVGIASPMADARRRSAYVAVLTGWSAALTANALGLLARLPLDGWIGLVAGGLVTLAAFALLVLVLFRPEVRLLRSAASWTGTARPRAETGPETDGAETMRRRGP